MPITEKEKPASGRRLSPGKKKKNNTGGSRQNLLQKKTSHKGGENDRTKRVPFGRIFFCFARRGGVIIGVFVSPRATPNGPIIVAGECRDPRRRGGLLGPREGNEVKRGVHTTKKGRLHAKKPGKKGGQVFGGDCIKGRIGPNGRKMVLKLSHW